MKATANKSSDYRLYGHSGVKVLIILQFARKAMVIRIRIQTFRLDLKSWYYRMYSLSSSFLLKFMLL